MVRRPSLIFVLLAVVAATAIAKPIKIGNFSTLAHDVSGTVYAYNERILVIKSMMYDGLGPATYFVAGSGPVSSNNFRLRVLPKCSGDILPKYSGETIVLEFPAGKTISDVDFISVWCETFTVNFGDVRIDPQKKKSVMRAKKDLSFCKN